MLSAESAIPESLPDEPSSSASSEYADVEDSSESDAEANNEENFTEKDTAAAEKGGEDCGPEEQADSEDPRQKNRLRALRCRRDTVPRGRRPVDYYHESERRNARRFAQRLSSDLIPMVTRLRSSIEADEIFQKFASDYATESCDPNRMTGSGGESDRAILNADGVYLATFSCLSLSLKLSLSGFYKGESEVVPLTEASQFFAAT